MPKIAPFLWFNDQAEQAAAAYQRLFPESHVGDAASVGDDAPGNPGKATLLDFQLAGQQFMALNGGPQFSFTPAISFFVTCQSEAEINALWQQLAQDATVLMELGSYPFSPYFGWLNDRFGVSWQLNLSAPTQKIAPCLLFVGRQHGKAETAMKFYTAIFHNSRVDLIERYGEQDGDMEGMVKHARFALDGQDFIVMDGGLAHDFDFNPSISFYVPCTDQAEVDYYWQRLGEGGEPGRCGWLTDPFGVSWQIVPNALGELMSDPDPEKARRATQAMLKMTKIDVAQLRQAAEQA